MSDLNSYAATSPAEPTSAPVGPERNRLFFGPHGLRAGWGILLFLLLLGIVFMALNLGAQIGALIHPLHPESPLYQPRTQIAASLLYMLTTIVAAVLLARRGAFGGGKAIGTLLLLIASLALLSGSIVHFRHVQQMLAAEKPAAAPQATPVAAPAANAQIQQGKAILTESISFGIVLLVSWIMSRIEHRRFGEYGLGGNRRRWPQLGQGALTGFGTLSVLILILYLGHWITFGGVLLHSAGLALEDAVLWLIAFILVGFFEEFAFRGYLQYTLARGIGRGAVGFFLAAVLFNCSFGFGHSGNPGESPIGLWAAGLIGFVFCISLWYTRSLWWAIGFHATWDWGESFFYGTADSGGVSQGRLLDSHPRGPLLMSGGETGPEGSAWVLLVIVLLALFIWATLRRERNKSTNQALVNPVA